MRIVVPIKQVPETSAVRMDEATGTMIREGVEAIVNPLDLFAIEAALRLRESGGGQVTVISMGPPKAAKALREAIAMGADSGVLLSDKAFAGADTWATGLVLAEAIRQLGPFDLVICGERATDGDTGQVGPGIASFLDLPVATYVSRIVSVADGVARVHRLVEDGYEVLDVDTPAVLTVVKEVADPRLPTLRGKQRAKAADLPVWGAAQLNLPADAVGLAGSPTRVVNIFLPKVARQCEKFPAADEAGIAQAADRVVALLKERALL
ncbi:MAG: electron transfer flavoprotein subunit beta/FixA family protein [Planctomycetota bacterium]|nr:electron transfer flavoprotein subunit beta/FixA family protein [Planctomycetota bacterium]